MDNIFYELIKYMTTYNYSSSLAIPLKLMGNLKGTSLPAVYASLASFRNEAKICQTASCTITQPKFLYHGYTMHVLRNTDYGSAAHRNPNVEQIPIMYNFYNSDEHYIGKILDEFGLINMPARRNANEGGNGRCGVYPDFIGNPVVGRFLSPDIVVQNPNNTQCYNRYSYCINNPLKYSDPSGWSYDHAWTRNHNVPKFNHNFLERLWGHNWSFNEREEWNALIEATGGNSLNNATNDYQDICGHMVYTENSLSNNASLSMPRAFTLEYKKLLNQGKYIEAATYMIIYFNMAESVNGVDLSCKYKLVERKTGNFGTIDPTETPNEEVVDENGEKLPSKIRIVPYLMNSNSPEWVYYALFHEFNHVYQFQKLDMYGNPLREEREFLAYSYTIRHAIDFRSTVKIDQITFDGGTLYNLGGWRGEMKKNYDRLSQSLQIYYENFYNSTWNGYRYY